MGQFLTQAKTLWNSLGLGPRVSVLSFVGGLGLLVTLLLYWSSQTDYVLLFGGLTPEDAAAISTRLGDDKIPYRYEASRGAIFVPAAKADSARLALAAMGLPKQSAEGFEIFDKNSFGTTDFVQRVKYLRALQGNLARTIQTLESVDAANVTVSLPEEEVFTRDKKEAKASVVVRMKAGRTLSPEQIASIRHLVASSVSKLDARHVTIVDSAGRLLSRMQEGDDPAFMTEEQLGLQRKTEGHFTDKVQSLLDQVLGPGKSAVRVTAQLNFERVERSITKTDPDSGVILEESSTTEESINRTAGPSGVPGVASNSVNGGGGGANTTESVGSSQKNKKIQNRYQYNTTTERVVPQMGAVKRLSVAVFVAPKSGADGAPVARTPQELTSLTEIIRSSVGFTAERQDVIKVEEAPFTETVSNAAALATVPAPWWEFLVAHLDEIFALIGVAILALVLRKTLQGLAPAPEKPADKEEVVASTSSTVNVLSDSPVQLTVQEEVRRLVSDDNEQAVSIIRSLMK